MASNRLQPLNLSDFSGGLNLRSSQVQLGDNETPEMENIVIDPVGGIYSRKGWERWNSGTFPSGDWDPMRAMFMQLADGTDLVYLANDHELFVSTNAGAFALIGGIECDAAPHMIDFAQWGDSLYASCGKQQPMMKRAALSAAATLTEASGLNWNDDYTDPQGGVAPAAELCETHSGYLFVGNTNEGGVDHPNRIRWSHPNHPEDWAELDFIDINTGGSRITALLSYEDHLLIFKTDSVWALYGNNLESWQLVEKSPTSGAPSPIAVSRSETTAFFYSSTENGAVFAYGGERPIEISTNIKPALSQITFTELVWVGWVGRKLWVTVPWNYKGGQGDSVGALVFDPSVGNGAWIYHRSEAGGIGPLVGGSNSDATSRPLAVLRNTEDPCVVRLDAIDNAYDRIDVDPQVRVPFRTSYRTPWFSAGWPTRKKSWRRPDILVKMTDADYMLQIASFRDYEVRTPHRLKFVSVTGSGGGAQWGDGVTEWGDGTVWGENLGREGAKIERVGSFGIARALQLQIVGATPGQRWGVDALILKYVARRFR